MYFLPFDKDLSNCGLKHFVGVKNNKKVKIFKWYAHTVNTSKKNSQNLLYMARSFIQHLLKIFRIQLASIFKRKHHTREE